MPPRRNKGKGKGKAIDQENIPSTEETENTNSNALDLDFTGYQPGTDLDKDLERSMEEDDDDIMEEDPELIEEAEDDDKDSIDEWMQDDEEQMDDNEITELLDKSRANRGHLKTGDIDEFQRDMEEFDNNLALTSGIGVSRLKASAKRRALAGEIKLSDEVKRQLGEANALYISRDYGSAIAILQEIITNHPHAHPAWNTLGLVHEELGNKPKSLQLRMVAAHMCNDAHLWKELAQKSIENNALKQAIYCLTKALYVDPTDVDALWDRSFLFKQIELTKLAVEGFKKILEYMPHHFKVINELAQLYRSEGKTKEAIQMYEDAIAYHTDHGDDENEDEEDEEDEEGDFNDKLGYSEINMLSELYLILNDYRKSLNTIKTGLRFVQKRQNETWWVDREDDDDEYLEEDEAKTDFPIELRVRMGICRVYLNQVRMATRHFQYLLQYPPTTYPDLHQDIAYAYYDKRHYDLALTVFQRLVDSSDEIEVDTLIRTADCYRETNDLETAVVFYVNVLEEQPDNLDVMMSLATVYEEQGNEDAAIEIVEYVMKKNRELRRQKKDPKMIVEDEEKNATETSEVDAAEKPKTKRTRSKQASIFNEQGHTLPKAEIIRQRKAERARRDQEMIFVTKDRFQKIDALDKQIGPSVRGAEKHLMREYIKTAQELWDDISSITAFYPRKIQKRFQGFYAIRRGKRILDQETINIEARIMAKRLRRVQATTEKANEEAADLDDEDAQLVEEEEITQQMIDASQFRGVPFDRWLRLIIKYAYMLSFSRRTEEAYEILRKTSECNIFYFDIPRRTSLKLAIIGCGLLGSNEFIAQDGTRWLCNFYQFRSDPYRIYSALMNSGSSDYSDYASYNQLKYVNRSIRLMDAIIARKRKDEGLEENTTAMEEISELNDAILAMNVDPHTASEQNYLKRFFHVPKHVNRSAIETMGIAAPKHVNPLLLSLFGDMMTLTKNYLASCLFHMRSFAVAPKDPLNTLSLGIALLQSAVQRKANNRHLQIMQGMMFIFEYVKLAGKPTQETEYNIARSFHLIGLTHLAIPHYEKALCLPSIANSSTKKQKPVEDVYKWPLEGEELDEWEQELDEEDETDIKREAAYNLHLIYITSGSMNLAQILLLKYCTI